MAKKEQLLRLVHIVKALEKAPEEGLSYQELYNYLKQKHEDKDCEKFSFSEKTFQRDRHLLEDIFMIYIEPNGKLTVAPKRCKRCYCLNDKRKHLA